MRQRDWKLYIYSALTPLNALQGSMVCNDHKCARCSVPSKVPEGVLDIILNHQPVKS